jgi:type IV pilus assembly protein PilA
MKTIRYFSQTAWYHDQDDVFVSDRHICWPSMFHNCFMISGYCLLELLFVVLIAEILFMIALTNFEQISKKVRVFDAVAVSAYARAGVHEHYAVTGKWLTLFELDSLGEYIHDIEQGAVTIHYPDHKRHYPRGDRLTMRPAIQANGMNTTLRWYCGYAKPDDEIKLAGIDKTDIPEQYLISLCRR